MTADKTNHAEEQAKAQYESVCEMVAALECDYDRLEELREEREALVEDVNEERNDDEANAKLDAVAALQEWDEDNGDELKELESAAGECKDQDEARERIQEDPLSIEVRSDWVSPGEEMTAGEFCILLCTGGPAARILGELDEHGEPYRAWMEYQDWGTPWTQFFPASQDTLLTYARCFCFSNG